LITPSAHGDEDAPSFPSKRIARIQVIFPAIAAEREMTLPSNLGRMLIAGSLLLLVAGANSAAELDIDRTMDEPTARAMLNRFGYGATPGSLAKAKTQTPRQYLTLAITDGSRLPAPVADHIRSLPIAEPLDSVWNRLGPGGSARDNMADEEAKKALRQEENQFSSATIQARLLTLANADNQPHEALLSFWLNHFSIFAPKHFDKLLAWDYSRAIEQAMREDSFEALLRASFYHAAMQTYLDNNQSTATNSRMAERAAERGKQLGINENLARELLELHTLGVDAGYALKDVQELARIITGCGIYSPKMRDQALAQAGATRRELFLFDPRRHDFGDKTFLGQPFPAGQGIGEVDRALHLIATHPATAHRVSLKLAQRFLADDPPPQLVERMATGFRRSGGKISATLIPLLESTEFSRSLQQPTKFKEPLDYLLSVSRAACGDTPINNRLFLAASALDMGEAPMMHSTPDGYASSEADWLSPAAMAKRLRLAMGLASERVPMAEGDSERIGRLKALAEDKKWAMRGTPCTVDVASVERMVGPVSAQTMDSASRLLPAERAALLLASPEFMRR
jgi:uncharacterized protein (DUF1800 family)